MTASPTSAPEGTSLRSDLRAGDLGSITRLHGTLYAAEYGVDARFEAGVAEGLALAVQGGWPARGAVRIAERDGEFLGSIALTVEGPGWGRIRWFLLDPVLRGNGLGRRMLSEMVAEAEALSLERVDLMTFSELRAAAHLYRSIGLEVVEKHRFSGWGRPILMQRYERNLKP